MFRVAMFAPRIGIVDRMGVEKIKEIVAQRRARRKTSVGEDDQDDGLLLTSVPLSTSISD